MKKIIIAIAVALFLASCASLSLPEDADLTQGGTWAINEFVDEFGFETGDKFIGTKFSGRFSNSATAGSSLSGKAFVYTDSFGQLTLRLDLYEYGNNPANFIGSNARFSAATENERLNSGAAGVIGNSFMLYNQNAQPIVEALARGEDVRIVIKGNGQTEWRVDLNSTGFGYQLQQFLG